VKGESGEGYIHAQEREEVLSPSGAAACSVKQPSATTRMRRNAVPFPERQAGIEAEEVQ